MDKKEQARQRAKAYYTANKEKVKNRVRAWNKANPGCQEKRTRLYKELVETCEIIKVYYGCANPKCNWKGEYHPRMLDFHHQNPENKAFSISAKRSKKMFAEINKCCVLCKNCHALVTFGELDASSFQICWIDSQGLPVVGIPTFL